MQPIDPALVSLRVAQARLRGWSLKKLRGDLWEHPHHGLVRPAHLVLDQPAELVADAIGLMSDGCVLGGWASRWYQGGQMCDGLDRAGQQRDVLVHCVPGARIRRRTGIKPFEGLLLPEEVVQLETIAVATLARATFDEMRLAEGLRETVVALDMGTSTTIVQARAGMSTIAGIVSRHRKLKGIVRIAQAFPYASSRSCSPWETRTRLVAVLDAGIADWEVNVPVFGLGGQLLGIPDMLNLRAGLVLESDGAEHRAEDRHNDDNEREEKFERAGLTVVRVGTAQHADRIRVVRRISAAYEDGLRSTRRAWTLDKPDWWWRWAPGRRWD
ncbi:MAG: hypothetical protein ACRDO8_02595 [Nocardioidaceae bacterium]